MSVEIPSNYSPVVQRLIAEGKYQNEEEIVAEGLRLVVLREQLDGDIQAGLDDLDAGNRIEASEVYAEARRRSAQRTLRPCCVGTGITRT